jgi:glucose/arabinose dehydrogenase
MAMKSLLPVGTIGLLMTAALAYSCGGGNSPDAQGGKDAAAESPNQAGVSGSSGRGGRTGTGQSGTEGTGPPTADSGSAAGMGGGSNAGAAGTDAAAAGAAGSGSAGAMGSCSGVPKLKLTKVFKEQGVAPLAIAQAKDDPYLYVLGKQGTIHTIKDGTSQEFFRLATPPPSDRERGLLGIALHPAYKTNGRFFVYYTKAGNDPISRDGEGALIIAEGQRMSDDPPKAAPTLKLLVSIPHNLNNHNGGTLAFGPDGKLYTGTGDGGSGGDPNRNGQNKTTLLGKLLRFDVDKMPIGAPEIWAIGLRNPWRFSFDRETGDLYIGDVGQNLWEEINFVKWPVPAGLNYGWNVAEGNHCFNASACDMTGFVAPITEYQHIGSGTEDDRSVTGGYVYRGSAIPCLRGRYIYAEYVKNRIFSFVQKDGKETDPVELTMDLRTPATPGSSVVSFGEDGAGELYLISGFDTTVYRIDAE